MRPVLTFRVCKDTPLARALRTSQTREIAHFFLCAKLGVLSAFFGRGG